MHVHIIFYVKNQDASTAFYSQVLELDPVINLPGMTEYKLSENCVFGLMPENGIKRLLPNLPDPCSSVPRAELYLILDDAMGHYKRALKHGARALSDFQKRDWGHSVAYCLDIDGHVLAFAQK